MLSPSKHERSSLCTKLSKADKAFTHALRQATHDVLEML